MTDSVHQPLTVRVADARRRLTTWVRRATQGAEIVITRHGEPVARLVPLAPMKPVDLRAEANALAARIRQHRAGWALGNGASVRDMIGEGRR